MSLYPWQQPTWQDLLKRSQSGLAHALLLTGHEGLGKHAFALHLAQWLLCKHARVQQSSAPCGQCHSCQLFVAGTHPDLLLCEPQEDSKQIKVDDVRKINEQLVQTPQISQVQVVILCPAEVMNINAANALLKTLEEPSGDSFLILEAERSGAVLPTIRSRCQHLHLSAPSTEQGVAWLRAQGVDEAQAQRAMERCGNAPLAAQQWLVEGSVAQAQWLQDLADLTAQKRTATEVAEAWSKLELSFVMQCFYLVLLDAMKVRAKLPVQQHSLQGEVVKLLNGATVDGVKLLTLQDKVQAVLQQQLAGFGNYNKQLLCESLLLKWQDLLKTA